MVLIDDNFVQIGTMRSGQFTTAGCFLKKAQEGIHSTLPDLFWYAPQVEAFYNITLTNRDL
jgi:hypothetical protein